MCVCVCVGGDRSTTVFAATQITVKLVRINYWSQISGTWFHTNTHTHTRSSTSHSAASITTFDSQSKASKFFSLRKFSHFLFLTSVKNVSFKLLKKRCLNVIGTPPKKSVRCKKRRGSDPREESAGQLAIKHDESDRGKSGPVGDDIMVLLMRHLE